MLSEPVRRMLRHLTAAHRPAVAKALTRVAFDVRDAEVRMAAQAFDYWSAITKQFIANPRSFPFRPATQGRMWAEVHAGTDTNAGRKVSDIARRQEFGFTLRPQDRERLTLGRSPASYAVPSTDPAAHLRTPRARVGSNQTPAALLASKGGGFAKFKKRRRRKKGQGTVGTHVFVTKNSKAILEKKPGGGTRLLYGLYDRNINVRPHFEFFETAAEVVGAKLLPRVTREMEKALGGFGPR